MVAISRTPTAPVADVVAGAVGAADARPIERATVTKPTPAMLPPASK